MADVKVTMKDKFNEVIKALNGEDTTIPTEELVTFIEGRIAQIEKKASSKKSAKNSEENIALANIILEVLTNEPTTVSELQNKDDRLAPPISNQKVSYILRTLVDEGKVVKTVEKRRPKFALV